MSTDIIRRVKEAGRLKGRLSFAVAGARTTLALPKTEVLVRLDGGPSRRLTVANFCVANARYFGGGMKVAPRALLDDGQFDVISIGDLSALKILANAHKLYRGTHLDMDEVQTARAKLVAVRPARKNQEVAIEIDGELLGRLPATFEILPRALRVRCPAS
jgi:diacylglycerol kinase family enzyme